MISYLASALFHDLTLSPPEHWILFATAGISVGLVAEGVRLRRAATVPERRAPEPSASARASQGLGAALPLRNSASSLS
jgi:hypothetical protein